ncbi:hypothetical protein N7495_006796 [Penicillium taxi]|uniref:uncharacterized protein n=1 Tax=Penicillium taxi TaxID=168475 RepID=UPI0025457062|nr:uncharacterized protein N7495_006796 [Penicillium taxi]KAJ5895105.1 hypothetical protein N7495_006796 [Penicillium taxi]
MELACIRIFLSLSLFIAGFQALFTPNLYELSPKSPTVQTDSTPRDSICTTHTIAAEENCVVLAFFLHITIADIENWNKAMFGWKGCGNLSQGQIICLSAGEPAMPVALPQAICGPQVPGTARPSNYASLDTLNPCQSNECCSLWGQCGTTSEFCEYTKCISNCKALDLVEGGKVKGSGDKKPATTTTSLATEITHFAWTKPAESTSTTTSAEVSAPTWSITMYADKDCNAKGGYYYVAGHNKKLESQCLVMSGGDVSMEFGDSGVACEWFPDGGFTPTSCGSSDLVKPKSYWIDKGQCNMYSDTKCSQFSGTVYNPSIGCQGPYRTHWGPSEAKSMMCSIS